MSVQHSTYDFHQLLILTEDDPEFRRELVEKYVTSFQSFPDEYAKLMRAGDAENLVFLIHRVKATVRMVGGEDLDRILELSPRLLADNADLDPIIVRVAQLCQTLVTEIHRL